MPTIQTFDFNAAITQALLWRNNEATNLIALLEFKQDYFDTENDQFWTDWETNVFNLKTADEFGLNVWSIILGVNITITSETPAVNTNWGFEEFRVNFFSPSNFAPTNSIVLGLEEARLVLRLRYYQLTTNCTVTRINEILADVFGDEGIAYVTDNNDMTIHYTFEFTLTSAVGNVFNTFDILPRPSGVTATFSSL